MTTARSLIVAEGVEAFYHCISRCVRRAFLCGRDDYTGRSFEHRKEWVRSRLRVLSEAFALDVCAFAIMSNHIHLVLRTRPDMVGSWSDEEVARHWLTIFPKNKESSGEALPPDKREIRILARDKCIIPELRRRLVSVSWFMRCLNECIARRANKEDGCKGRFWEGRFKCQALLDEAGLLACMAYVDLNPVRAGIADSPEESEFTSVHERFTALNARSRLELRPEQTKRQTPKQLELLAREKEKADLDRWLSPIGRDDPEAGSGILSMTQEDYLKLIDWTGRQIKYGHRGAIPEHLSPIMVRLQIDSTRWLDTVSGYGSLFWRVAGRLDSMLKAAQTAGRRWLRGLKASRMAFSTESLS